MSQPGGTLGGFAPRPSNVPQPALSADGSLERGERGYRRRKLAAMAGNLYRTGQQAVTEIRETYAQSRARGLDGAFDTQTNIDIPSAFPDVDITAHGNEQMVLFPCYAKRHTKRDRNQALASQSQATSGSLQDEEYWRHEWERHQDEKAVVDVDVRGWIYSPQTGPMTRRNRILIGLARQLSGITTPRGDQSQLQEELREQERIADEAARIERRGQEEKRIASSGAYSERPQENGDSTYLPRPPRRGGSLTPDSAPGSPSLLARQSSLNVNELTEAELAVANANLMARVAPFMTNPVVALPITIFFYNATESQSRTVLTNEAGHFAVRAPLGFVPTNFKVLANERLSTTREVKIIEPYGVSVISDIDDTVKLSNISGGAREIFRNTFVRELADLTIEGVTGWYSEMHTLGVNMHYCSNSPWQLFPMLATFFKVSGLPPGSLHLKQYSGMLQGIFEPVAERKKNTLTRLLQDFSSRKFILVGDSGEADLEVYTELALANPGRVLAVFMRDVTTPAPESAAYFESSFDLARRTASSLTLNDGGHAAGAGGSKLRQNSAPGSVSEARPPAGPVMGTLIDFSEEPEEANLDHAAALEQVRNSRPAGPSASAADLLARKPPPPPRPAKPAVLSSAPTASGAAKGPVGLGLSVVAERSGPEPPPKPPRKPAGLAGGGIRSVATTQAKKNEEGRATADRPVPPPPPPPPRRRVTPSSSLKNLSPRVFALGRGPSSSNSDVDFDPLPPPSLAPPAPAATTGMSYYRPGSRSGNTSPSGSPTLRVVSRKLELWRRRVARAHEQLDQVGVALYTWRRGQDVEVEALAIVKRALGEMEREARRRRR